MADHLSFFFFLVSRSKKLKSHRTQKLTQDQDKKIYVSVKNRVASE